MQQAVVQPEPAARPGLVAGHLSLRSTTTTGSLDDAEAYEFELAGRDIMIGRSPGCDISLPDDPLASRRHAMVYSRSEGYTIVDLGSINGTLVNDVELREETMLHDGDIITVGRHTILVSSAPARPDAPAIDSRATGPLALLPSDDTDPHVQALGATATPEGEASAPTTDSEPESISGDEAASAIAFTVDWASTLESVDSPDAAAALGSASMSDVADAPASDGDVFSLAQPTPASPIPAQQHDLDALQNQLTDLIHSLRQQAEETRAASDRLRRALADVRETLTTALDTQLEPAEPAFSFNVDKLTELARRTAENPRHLDYVLSLSERAEELAIVLEAVQRLQTDGGALELLQGLQARVERALE
jgi:pSer/pThr/pTyr-binding forkhead associated (FHA) protein